MIDKLTENTFPDVMLPDHARDSWWLLLIWCDSLKVKNYMQCAVLAKSVHKTIFLCQIFKKKKRSDILSYIHHFLSCSFSAILTVNGATNILGEKLKFILYKCKLRIFDATLESFKVNFIF